MASKSFGFAEALHKKDISVLRGIQDLLGGVGKIRDMGGGGEGMVILMVRSLKEITQVVLPHFDKYPLITQKYADYLLFKEVIAIMERKEHLTLEGLNKIVAIRSSINLGLSDKLKEAFPNIIPVIRPYVDLSKHLPLDSNRVSGFISAEGCFLASVAKSLTHKSGRVCCSISIADYSTYTRSETNG